MFLVFNGDTDEQDIVHLMNDLVGSTENTYSLKAKARDCNTASRLIWSWIHEAYGGWEYDDSNNTTDFPIARTNLVASQQDYGLPSDGLTIRGLEVKNAGGTWFPLIAITEEQVRERMAEAQFMSTPSMPTFYVPLANSVKLYPAPNFSQSASLRVTYDRGITAFASTDNTKSPGFNSQFHEAVAYGGALQFAKYKTLPQAGGVLRNGARTGLLGDFYDYEQKIKLFYRSRYQELFPGRITVRDMVRENK